MFSPESTLLGAQQASTHNPRRRQRHGSESFKQEQAPRRKRSRLSSETFMPPSSDGVQPDADLDANGHLRPATNGGSKLLQLQGMPVREKKQSHKGARSQKGDRGSILMKTKNYAVNYLPSLPTPLQAAEYNFATLYQTRHALAITRNHAYVWDYTTTRSASKYQIFDLPNTVKPTELLPVGALLASGPANEVGVVIVTAAGKITFWENVENPESFSFFQRQRYSATGIIGGMLSGEKVSDIVSAEHAGFIVVFSTGRLAHLTLRDAQGKPHLSTRYLQNQAGNESNGFFGGLKSVFGAGSWRADLATVKTRPSNTKSNMNVIAATSHGEIHIWEIDWSGQQEYKGVIDAQVEIEISLKNDTPTETQVQGSIKIVDFAFNDHGEQNNQEAASSGAMPRVNIMALLEQTGKTGSSIFMLVGITLDGTSTRVGRPIRCELAADQTKRTGSQSWPRIYLPRTGDTAVIVFAFTIIVISILAEEFSPDSQLLMEAHAQNPSQQDVIHLVKEEKARIIGCFENLLVVGNQEAELAIFSKGVGLLGLSIFGNEFDISSDQSKIQTQIEQAVFYGHASGTIIDFDNISSTDFTLDQIQDAAIEISRNIIRSRVDLIHTKPSMAEQLSERGRLLQNLALYLKRVFPPLSRSTKWNLLWTAEKVECALHVWSLFEARYAKMGPGHHTNLEIAVACMHESQKTALDRNIGETDPMRTWFTRDIEDFDCIIDCVYQAIRQDYDRGNRDALSVLGMAREANAIALTTLGSAFQFRSDNLALYGLEHDALDVDGPDANFSGLSDDIWTSTFRVITPLKDLIDYSRMVMLNYGEEQLVTPTANEELSSSTPEIELYNLAATHPHLIQLASRSQNERIKRIGAQGEQQRALAQRLIEESQNWLRKEILAMQEVELYDDAIDMARETNDMPLLVKVIEKESDMHTPYLNIPRHLLGTTGLSEAELKEHRVRMGVLIRCIQEYFQELGWEWANPYYRGVIQRGTLGGFMNEALANEKFATRFLRENEELYAKLGWINEVLRNGQDREAGRKDLSRAGDMLTDWASGSEKNLWSAKVEANIAKLAYMAQGTARTTGTSARRQDLASKFEAAASQVKLVKIQERIYAHVAPVSETAIDATAKIELTMAEFARRVIRLGRKGHARTLQACLEKLLRLERLPPTELIELLTLMDRRKCDYEENDISGQECGLALSVLELAELEAQKLLEQGWVELIWKRAMVRDDWKTVNATQGKSDAEVNKLLEGTETCGAFKVATLFDPSSPIKPVPPEECQGAGVDPNEVQFPLADNRLADLWAKDNAADDELLNNSLTHHRLAYWFERSRVVALEALDEEAKSNENARTREIEEGLALLKEMEGPFTDGNHVNGHVSANASANGIGEEVNGVDEQYEDEIAEGAEEDATHDEPYGDMQEGAFFRSTSKGNRLEPAKLEIKPSVQEGPIVDLTGDDDDEEETEEGDYVEGDGDEEMYDGDDGEEEDEGEENGEDEGEENGEDEDEEDETDPYEGDTYEGDGEVGYGESEDVDMEG